MEGGDGGREEGGKSVPEGGDWSGPWSPEKGMGEGGRGTPGAGTDGALAWTGAAGGRREPGALRGWGWGSGAWGGTREPGGGLPARFLARPGPCAPSRFGAGRLPCSQHWLGGGARFGRSASFWGRPGATPLFPTFFRSSWGLARGCVALEPAGRRGSGGEIAGQREEDPERTRPAWDPEQVVTREGIGQVIDTRGSPDSDVNLA